MLRGPAGGEGVGPRRLAHPDGRRREAAGLGWGFCSRLAAFLRPGWPDGRWVIDSDNELVRLGPFQSRRWPVERNYGRTRSPYTAAGYPRATSRGRRAVAGELGSSLVCLPRQ